MTVSRLVSERLRLLSAMAEKLLTGPHPHEQIEPLCGMVMRHLGCDAFVNYLLDEASGRLRLHAWAGLAPAATCAMEWLDMGEGLCGRVAAEGQRIILDHLSQSTDPTASVARSLGMEAVACHPMRMRGRVMGTLTFGSRSQHVFGADDLDMMKATTDLLAIALERVRLLEDARRRAADAARAGRARDEFMAVISHELRTPLMPALLGLSQLEQRADLPADVRDELAAIRRNVQLEARLIDDLLDLTVSSQGKLGLDARPTDLHAVITTAARTWSAGPLGGIDLELTARRHWVRGDEGRLQQVFNNLLSNARKFTPESGRITVRSVDCGESILVHVVDEGVGIDPAFLPRVFDAFQQASGGYARQYGGMGLGLTIARRIVEAHGGTVRAHSEGKGRGAAFTIALKTICPAISHQDSPRAKPPKARALRVLVVEDHPATLKSLERLLRAWGHDVRTAMDVRTALEMAMARPPDLLISDLGLPDGSGHDVMMQLRQRFGLPGIALSGYGLERDIQRSREVGFIDHLVKPIDVGQLEAAVGRVMQSLGLPVE